ncbi:MAG: hypothetical protein LAT53_11530 [Idiomarina sp.]|nr:hypothetical protein [Idiomarina sp.]
MQIHYFDRLLILSKLQRRSMLVLGAALVVAAVYKLGIAQVWHQRASLQNSLASAKAQLSVPSEEVRLAAYAELPGIPHNIHLNAFKREGNLVQLTLHGDFTELANWLQQLADINWAPTYKRWQWQPQHIELIVHLEQQEMQVVEFTAAAQNPFPTLSHTPKVAEVPISEPCFHRFPEDFSIVAIRNQEALLHYNNHTTRWLRAGATITPYALIIQYIGEGGLVIAHHHNNTDTELPSAKPLKSECAPSTLQLNIPTQQYLRWLP